METENPEEKTPEHIEDEIHDLRKSQENAVKRTASATWWIAVATVAIAVSSVATVVISLIDWLSCQC